MVPHICTNAPICCFEMSYLSWSTIHPLHCWVLWISTNTYNRITTTASKIQNSSINLLKALVVQLCLILCDAMDCNLPGSSVRGNFQTRILEWIAISFSRGSFWPKAWTWVSCIAGRLFTVWATREAHHYPPSCFSSVNRKKFSALFSSDKFGPTGSGAQTSIKNPKGLNLPIFLVILIVLL